MTDILPTPADWPAILLGREPAAAADLPSAVRDGAFESLKRAIRDLGPTATTATVGAARLRGRGGGGFLAADKWRAAAAEPADRRYVVANGYEADPGTRTDRTLLERDPWLVLEGLAICAWSVGASDAILAIRGEETRLRARLDAAVGAAEAAGFLGTDVLGSGRDLRIEIRPVSGAYMLGEETVLLKALEGRRGQPEQRPPHPAVTGLFGRPTVVHNVATLAALPWILRQGSEAFAAIGDPEAPGTILVHVRGAARDGVAEVPTGTTLGRIAELGGGVSAGHRLRAVVVGGPSGGFLPPDLLDTPYTFDAIRAVGAHVGSGSVMLADERASIPELAMVLTRFCAAEACGKTIPCRIGTRRLVEIGERLTSDHAGPSDQTLLAELAVDIVASGLCDHERLTTLPLTSGMRYFASDLLPPGARTATADPSASPSREAHGAAT